MDGGSPWLWGRVCLPVACGRNLHHLHVSRRKRLRPTTRARRPTTFYAMARLPTCSLISCCRRSGATPRSIGSTPSRTSFVRKYDSPALGIIVTLVDIVALIPYLVLQFKGLGIIVEIAGYGAISSKVAIWTGDIVVVAYVMVSGVHGSAWTSVAKDILIVVVVVFLGLYLPSHYYGGLGSIFQAIEQAKPGFTVLPPHGESLWWFSSTVLLTALGFYMWPHSFGSIYTARNATVIREERRSQSCSRSRAPCAAGARAPRHLSASPLLEG